MPALTSASRARWESSALTIRSRSCRVSGPPRAQLARLPPRRNGTSAPRSAAPAFLSACSIAVKSSSAIAAWLPGGGERVSRRTMTIATDGRPAGHHDECRIRIAAAGDVHYGERDNDPERAAAAFGALEGRVDMVLLAGDLTTHGRPEQAAIVASACRGLGVPVLTVLGNHDWHSNRAAEVRAALEEGGIVVLERSHHVLDICETSVGVVGTKGFVGGFTGSHIPDW